MGTKTGSDFTDSYLFNFMDSPNTLNDISYTVFYQLENNTTFPVGLIADASAATMFNIRRI